MRKFLRSDLFRTALLFTIILQLGTLLSLWFGFGWFVLGLLGPRVVLWVPELYFPFTRMISGWGGYEIVKSKVIYPGKNVWSRRLVGLVYLGIIILTFWQLNVPLLEWVK